jgi:hypothetical protein
MPTLHRTTRIASCCIVAVLAGCAKKNDATADSTSASSTTTTTTDNTTMAPAPAPAPAPAAINLADVAGKWDMRAVPTSGDTTSTNFVLTATIKYPGRAAVPEAITVSGDSIITTAGPYPSFRRKGVTVTTNGVFRLQNGSLVGTNTAHYKVKTADSVLVLNTTGTRAK